MRLPSLSFALLLTAPLMAQLQYHFPPPLLPVVPPPVDHPAYAGQPLMNPPKGDEAEARPAPARPAPARQPEAEAAAAFQRQQIKGKELAKRIDKVIKSLHWHEQLVDALAAAAADGKPVLWIQALGDVDGFT